MQQLLNQFQSELKDTLDEIWARPPEETPVDSWASRMVEAEKDRKTNPIDRVTKPDLPSTDWKISLFDEGVV
jgi:elongator complex protein 1